MKFATGLIILMALSAGSALAGGDAEQGKAKSAACAACHGEAGMSIAPTFPNLAGQYEDYLYQSLMNYKNGKRTNPIMVGQVAALSEQDMKDLAAYYASQKGLFSLDIDK